MSHPLDPVSPDLSMPMWERRYFCPQCRRLNQPRDGFDLSGFIDHTTSHSVAYLRDALGDLQRLDFALHELEANTKSIPGLALTFIDLALTRAFRHKDDGAFQAWAAAAHAAKCCPTCQSTKKDTAPDPAPPPAPEATPNG